MDNNPLDKLRGAGYNQAKNINSQPPLDAPQDTPPVQPVTPPANPPPAFNPPPVIEPSPPVNPPAEPQMPADAPADSPPPQPPQFPPFPPQQPTEPEEKPSEPTEQKPGQPDPKPNTAKDNPFQSNEKSAQKGSKLPEVKVKLDLAFLKAKYVVLFLAIATGIAGSALAIYSYQKLNSSNTLGAQVIADSERLSEKEIEALKDKVSLIAVLPEGEIPIVLPITDLTKLHSNEFFKDAKLKDKILIFKQAGKIILYDPINNKIVNMGPYSETQTQIIPSPTPLPTPTPEATASPTLKKTKNPN